MKYVVIDLEMNPVDRDFREVKKHMKEEVIEFGAVRLDENFQQEAEFQCYVEPEYGKIKKHITNLTGIKQEMVTMPRLFSALWTGLARKKRKFTPGACRTSNSSKRNAALSCRILM